MILELSDIVLPAHEWLYRSSILSFLRGSDVNVSPEVHTNKGRVDLVISCGNKTWAIEIKVAYKDDDPKKKLDEAMQQIKEKNYAKQFSEVICLAIVIDDEKREIDQWLMVSG